MVRAAARSDVFTAIAEPRRRRLLELLAGGRMSVGVMVSELRWPQPMVSKHLGVLRKAGLVHVQAQSRQKIYELHADDLAAVHTWAQTFAPFWKRHLKNIKARAEASAMKPSTKPVQERKQT